MKLEVVTIGNRPPSWLREGVDQYRRRIPKVQFFVGGPDGMDNALIDGADDIWSLSRLTFPHSFVPLLILEQIYRAWTMKNHHPYHR